MRSVTRSSAGHVVTSAQIAIHYFQAALDSVKTSIRLSRREIIGLSDVHSWPWFLVKSELIMSEVLEESTKRCGGGPGDQHSLHS